MKRIGLKSATELDRPVNTKTWRKILTLSAFLSHEYCYASNDDLKIDVGDVAQLPEISRQ